MGCVRADDVHHVNALGGEGLGHHVGGLFLAVDFSAIGDERTVENVERVVGGVIHAPELLFPPRRLECLPLKHLEEISRLRESRAGRRRRPQSGMVRGDMPAGRAAEGKPAHDQPVFIDGIILLHMIKRLKQVGLAGEPVAIAIAAVKMNDESVGRRELARRSQSAVDKIEFGQCFAASMKPKVEAIGIGGIGLITWRDHQAVGLH